MFLSHYLLRINFQKLNCVLPGTCRLYHLVPQTQALRMITESLPRDEIIWYSNFLYYNNKGSEISLSSFPYSSLKVRRLAVTCRSKQAFDFACSHLFFPPKRGVFPFSGLLKKAQRCLCRAASLNLPNHLWISGIFLLQGSGWLFLDVHILLAQPRESTVIFVYIFSPISWLFFHPINLSRNSHFPVVNTPALEHHLCSWWWSFSS